MSGEQQALEEKNMWIDLNETEATTVPGRNGGAGTMTVRMYTGEQEKIILCAIHPGDSNGLHRHETSDDINYVVSGKH